MAAYFKLVTFFGAAAENSASCYKRAGWKAAVPSVDFSLCDMDLSQGEQVHISGNIILSKAGQGHLLVQHTSKDDIYVFQELKKKKKFHIPIFPQMSNPGMYASPSPVCRIVP